MSIGSSQIRRVEELGGTLVQWSIMILTNRTKLFLIKQFRQAMKSLVIALFASLWSSLLHSADLAAELHAMVGKSAEKLHSDHQATLNTLFEIGDGKFLDPDLWHLWTYTTPDKSVRFVAFAGQHIMMIPGQSSARVVILDGSGKVLLRSSFSTGWRIDITNAMFSFDKHLNCQLLELASAPVINGRNIRRQLFGIVDDRLLFLCMEDDIGTVLRNSYLSPNHTIGGSPPAKTLDGCLALLKSSQPAMRLAALTYLAGNHMDPDRPRTRVQSESVEDARLARSFRNYPDTKGIVTSYVSSDIAWISKTATMALDLEDED